MKRLSRALVALPVSALFLVLASLPAHATVIVTSQISFSGLSITPGGGTAQFGTNWQASAFAQAGDNNQFNSGGSPGASAAGDFSFAQSGAFAPVIPAFNVSGSATASNAIIGNLDASDQAAAHGTVWEDQFEITGGSGAVNTTFSMNINGFLTAFTDMTGMSAEAETVFTLQLDGNPILFNDQLLSIGQNNNASVPISTTLSASTTLQYNTVYQLLIEGDAEASALNVVPEPGTGALAMMGALTALYLRRKRKRSVMQLTKHEPRNTQHATRNTALFLSTVVLLASAGSSLAMYIGSDPPLQPSPANRQSGGTIVSSLTEGNLKEVYPVVSFQSGSGSTLQMSLTYNSYNADGSRAQIECGLGLGWTHSYNLFLFTQRGSFSLMGPDGRITLFHLAGSGTYIADSGYFETLTPLGGSAYAITNKEQSWWIFNSVPNTPFLVAGPVYRLIQMGDRNNNVTSLTYSNGFLTQVSDPYGRLLQFSYTNNSRLGTITDPLGRITRLQYDSKFRTPIRITDPQGNSVRYTYNSLYQLTRKMDRDNRTYFYLFRNKLPWTVLDGNAQTWSSMFNPNNWGVDRSALSFFLRRIYFPSTTTNIDGNGNVWKYQYDTNGYVTQLTAPDNTSTSYSYDPLTRELATVTNADGAVTRYQYDSEGNRTNVTDALGNVTRYTYDPVFNQLTSMTDPMGRVTTYQYDSRGNRTSEIDPLNETNRWAYDSHGNVTTFTDRNGHTTIYTYDAFGDRTNMTDPLGNVTTYTYDAIGNRLSTTDPLGNTTRYQYDTLYRVADTTNALGGVSSYGYDAVGREISLTDPNTNPTSYQYDTRGRLAQTTDALGKTTGYGYDLDNNRVLLTNDLGGITTYDYDSENRETNRFNPLGGVTIYTYDPVGNRISTTDPRGNTTTYTYDALNRRIAETTALNGVTIYDYSSPSSPPCCSPSAGSSLVTEVQDANGKVTYYHYDEVNRLVQVLRKNSDTNDVINPTDAVTTTAYDSVGNVIAVTNPVMNTTIYTYDFDNRQITITDPVGSITQTSYDADGNVLRINEPNGNIVTNVYDALNRVTAVYDVIGNVSMTAYDSDGNVISTADGLGHTTSYNYDALNRQTAVIDGLGNTTSYAYDAAGDVVTNVDRLGRTTIYSYDALDRRTSILDPLGNTTSYSYDAVGNVTNATDANGRTTSYGYDALNRRVTETYPDLPPNTRTTVYDGVGNVIQRTDQDGNITIYSYNDLYYLTNRIYSPSGANDRFIYDDAGRILSEDRNGWVETYIYDGANRVTSSTENGRTITYQYDAANHTLTNDYPSGRTIIYTYDARDRTTSIQDGTPNPPITVYTYDDANRIITRSNRNGTTTTYSYNTNDWITSLVHSNSPTLITGFNYAYDAEGNQLYESKLDAPTISSAYAYDALDRLTNYDVGTLVGQVVPAPSIAKSWLLDPVGNWLKVVSNGIPELRTYGPADELISINGQTNHYDPNGNLIQDPAFNYTYDEEDRLTQLQRRSDSAIVGQYFYDALGRRIVEVTDASGSPATNVFFYDGSRIVEEVNGGGATEATYVYGACRDGLQTMDRAGQTYYYHQNATHSPLALTDSGANVVERYAYDAYGRASVLDGSYNPIAPNAWGTPHSAVTNSFLFKEQSLDEESGLYAWFRRIYDSVKGYFLQRSQSTQSSSENKYQSDKDNPESMRRLIQAPLSPAQMLKNAETLAAEARSAESTIARLLARAREQHDPIKVLCLRDRLSRANTTLRMMQDRLATMRSALFARPAHDEVVSHEYTLIVHLSRYTSQALDEAHACLGSSDSSLVPSETEGTVILEPPVPESPDIESTPAPLPLEIIPSRSIDNTSGLLKCCGRPEAIEPSTTPEGFGATGGGEGFPAASPAVTGGEGLSKAPESSPTSFGATGGGETASAASPDALGD